MVNLSPQITSMRLFFALWPDRSLQQSLGHVASEMSDVCGGRVMRAETIHMTLLFLGDTECSRLESLKAAAAEVECRPFTLHLQRFACWPHNRIGYIGPVRPSRYLFSLEEALRSHVGMAGFRADTRRFVPHMTLLRKVDSIVGPRMRVPLEWRVKEFVLMASVLTEQGSRYQKLASWPLQ